MTEHRFQRERHQVVAEILERFNAQFLRDEGIRFGNGAHGSVTCRADFLTRFRSHVLGLDDSYPGRDAAETTGLIGRWRDFAADLAQRRKPFNLICVSMGGNDIIGKNFAQHLFPAQTDQPGFDWPGTDTIPDIVRTRISIESLRRAFDAVASAYGRILTLRDDFAPGATVITHTYADVTPSNTPYTFPGIKAGPWIWRPLARVGIKDPAVQREISRWLLLSFANMMIERADDTSKAVVLDTREELPDFDGWWDNEIHPLGPGFKLLAKEYWFPEVSKALGVP